MRRRSFNTAMICARIPSENEIGALNYFISDYYIISNHLCEGMRIMAGRISTAYFQDGKGR